MQVSGGALSGFKLGSGLNWERVFALEKRFKG